MTISPESYPQAGEGPACARSRLLGGRGGSPASSGGEPGIQVGEDVRDRLQPDREAHQPGSHARGEAVLVAHRFDGRAAQIRVVRAGLEDAHLDAESAGVRVMAVSRLGSAMLPTADLVVQEGDVLYLAVAHDSLAHLDALSLNPPAGH